MSYDEHAEQESQRGWTIGFGGEDHDAEMDDDLDTCQEYDSEDD